MSKLLANLMQVVALGVKDWWHDRRMSLLLIASLTSVIAPLLLLFALKSGVVSQLLDDLRQDPATLEVKIRGNWQLDQAWLDTLKAQPFVKFAEPMTRALNLSLDLRRDSRTFVKAAELIPTGDGEPLFPEETPIPSNWRQIVISEFIAEHLKLKVGDTIKASTRRSVQGEMQQAQLDLQVVSIVGSPAIQQKSVFVSGILLRQIEAYKDGWDPPSWQLEPNSAELASLPVRSYAKARVYASSIEQVAPLVAYLESQNLPVRSSQQAIKQVQAITYVLTTIFVVVAATAIIGCVASMIGAFVANVERKRKELATLRLLGFGTLSLNSYLLLQAILTALIAFVCGALLSITACGYLNHSLTFGNDTQLVCQMGQGNWILGLSVTLLTAACSALFAGIRAAKVQPAEILREQ